MALQCFQINVNKVAYNGIILTMDCPILQQKLISECYRFWNYKSNEKPSE